MIELDDLRTAHSQGNTFTSYCKRKNVIVTSGQDGDIRVYPGLYEDETVSIPVGSKILCLIVWEDKVAVGTEQHDVKVYDIETPSFGKTILRFTAAVHCLSVDNMEQWLAAGASDFKIKLVTLDGNNQKTLGGHNAPLLSVNFTMNNETLVSSSCDGSVKIWKCSDQTCIKSVNILPLYNSYENISTLSYESHKKLVAIPCSKSVKVLLADSLTLSHELSEEHTEIVTVVAFSCTGKYLVTGSLNGEIFVWNNATQTIVEKFHQNQSKSIASLQWNSEDNGEILFGDSDGQFGFCSISVDKLEKEDELLKHKSLVGLNEDEDDEKFDLSYRKTKRRADAMDLDEDLADVTTSKKHRVNNMDNFLDDEADEDDEIDDNNISLNLIKEGLLGNTIKKPMIDEEEDSMSSFIVDKKSFSRCNSEKLIRTLYMLENDSDKTASKYHPTKETPVEVDVFLQEPFQPSATPVHLMHRFMVWNVIGIIRSHAEEDMSIDVEFHNASTHHSLHMSNAFKNTMAALSFTVVVFACKEQDTIPSKLTCLHFASWDSNKEWTISMEKGEDIMAIDANNDYVIATTSNQIARIFSVAGMQLQIVCLVGPVVTMAMSKTRAMIICHKASGLQKRQVFSIMHLEIRKGRFRVTQEETFSLKPKLILTWAGYTKEGNPTLVESSGSIYLRHKQQNAWIVIGNTKQQAKNKSDNYWVISIEEGAAQIRCIYCKGANFPALLPRPVPTIIPFQLPLCEMNTEKSKLEHDLMKHSLISNNLKQADETEFEQLQNKSAQLLMQLFAFACKSDRDYRAVEVCKLMTNVETVQLAIRYASSLKKMGLAKKLDQLARDKVEEIENAEDEIEEEDNYFASEDEIEEDIDIAETEEVSRKEKKEGEYTSTKKANDASSKKITLKKSLPCSQPSKNTSGEDLFDANDDDEEMLSSTELASQPASNPFRVNNGKANSKRGTEYFDNLQSSKLKTACKGSKQTVVVGNSKTKSKPKPISNNKQSKITSKVTPPSSKNAEVIKIKGASKGAEVNSTLSGFQLFREQHKENCDTNEEEFTQTVMRKWRELSKEEKSQWNSKVKGGDVKEKTNSVKKPEIQLNPVTMKNSSKDKLNSFAFNKN